ncbi:ATP-binding protein [Embleya sp. NPDC020886]|uniref:ATP-binding protein n=1 Tax=Embleya sp. NPDC020886 TaxID=3363980 RepID=UPI003790F22F
MNSAAPQLRVAVRVFELRLTSTRRGARLAHQLAVEELRAWGLPPAVVARARQIVAELAANAALHGSADPSRGFRLTLTADAALGTLRIGVADSRPDCPPTTGTSAEATGESGRGLLIVTALCDRWGIDPHPPTGKTVWTELDLPHEGRVP